jgi:L-malate glycosyltransferase
MNILFLTSWYPSEENPVQGVFVQAHARAVSLHHPVRVIHCPGADRHLGRWWEYRCRVLVHDGGPGRDCGQIVVDRLRYRLIRVPGVTLVLSWAAIVAACLDLRRVFDPDIIHVHMYPLALPAILLGKFLGVPVVLTEHSSAFARGRLSCTERTKAKIAFTGSDICLPVSGFLKKKIQALGIRANFDIIPNVVDRHVFYPGDRRTRAPAPDMPVTLLFAGMTGSSDVKGLDLLFAALAILKRRGRPFVCQVIGDARDTAWCRALRDRLDLGREVVFCGVLPKSGVAAYMRATDFLVVPSRVETFSVVTLEALCCGLPVLCTRCGGPEELVNDACGRIVDAGDSQALAAGMISMIRDLDRFDRGAIARHAGETGSQEAVCRRLSHIYGQVRAARKKKNR